MTQREIVGLQERFERSGAQRLRDIRPITTRLWSAMMSEFSGLILAGGAMPDRVPTSKLAIMPRRGMIVLARKVPRDHGGNEFWTFAIAVSLDSFAYAFASIVLITYMSSLASTQLAASQYALLTSICALPGSLLAGPRP
jgi:hypothetical protein